MKLNSKSINYNVQTVDELVSLDGLEGDTVVVTDEDRGGVFVYREDNVGTNNGGTIFNGWTRQYDLQKDGYIMNTYNLLKSHS